MKRSDHNKPSYHRLEVLFRAQSLAKRALVSSAKEEFKKESQRIMRAFLDDAKQWWGDKFWNPEIVRQTPGLHQKITDRIALMRQQMAEAFDKAARDTAKQAILRSINGQHVQAQKLGVASPMGPPALQVAIQGSLESQRKMSSSTVQIGGKTVSIRESNDCHDEKGKFCSSPGGERNIIKNWRKNESGDPVEEPLVAMLEGDTRRRTAKVVVLEPDGWVWLQKPFSEPFCMLPGGGVEPGETFRQAAVREVLEETGMTVEIDAYLYDASDQFSIRRFYVASRVGPLPMAREDEDSFVVVDHDGSGAARIVRVSPEDAADQLTSDFDLAALLLAMKARKKLREAGNPYHDAKGRFTNADDEDDEIEGDYIGLKDVDPVTGNGIMRMGNVARSSDDEPADYEGFNLEDHIEKSYHEYLTAVQSPKGHTRGGYTPEECIEFIRHAIKEAPAYFRNLGFDVKNPTDEEVLAIGRDVYKRKQDLINRFRSKDKIGSTDTFELLKKAAQLRGKKREAGDFNEEDHPRDAKGKFAPKGIIDEASKSDMLQLLHEFISAAAGGDAGWVDEMDLSSNSILADSDIARSMKVDVMNNRADALGEIPDEELNSFIDRFSLDSKELELDLGFENELAKAAAALIVSSWADSSQLTVSSGMQKIADKMFQLNADKAHLDDWSGQASTEISKDPVGRRVLEAFVSDTYEATQQWFKERGIDEVTLFRGEWEPHISKTKDGSDLDKMMTVRTQPLSSFSISPHTAVAFASQSLENFDPYSYELKPGEKLVPVVYAAKVPVSKIFSTPFTGPGSLQETECILLGGKFTVHRVPYQSGIIERMKESDPWTSQNQKLSTSIETHETPIGSNGERKSGFPPIAREIYEKWKRDGIIEIDKDEDFNPYAPQIRESGDFEEDKHPRDDHGRFTVKEDEDYLALDAEPNQDYADRFKAVLPAFLSNARGDRSERTRQADEATRMIIGSLADKRPVSRDRTEWKAWSREMFNKIVPLKPMDGEGKLYPNSLLGDRLGRIEAAMIGGNHPFEHLRIIGPDGRELVTRMGGSNFVEFGEEDAKQLDGMNAVMTHNHPSGRAFSYGDLLVAAAANMNAVRAVGTSIFDGIQRIYEMAKTSKYWPDPVILLEAYDHYYPRIFSAISPRVDKGELSYEQANFMHQMAMNHRLAKELSLKFTTRKVMTPSNRHNADVSSERILVESQNPMEEA